jgi:hypothetical protein
MRYALRTRAAGLSSPAASRRPPAAGAGGGGGKGKEGASPGAGRSRRPPPDLARMLPIGPGGLQSGFSTLRYVRRDFRKKNRVRGLPAPPVAPRSWVP